MDEMIAYCGYSCHICAARSDDAEVRQRLVNGWRQYLGHQDYTADNVRCVGCLNDGPHADVHCSVRPCAVQRGVSTCAVCAEVPCDRLRGLLASREELLVDYHRGMGSMTAGEYDLCLRQFESMPNLVRMLVDAGKLPGWVRGETPIAGEGQQS